MHPVSPDVVMSRNRISKEIKRHMFPSEPDEAKPRRPTSSSSDAWREGHVSLPDEKICGLMRLNLKCLLYHSLLYSTPFRHSLLRGIVHERIGCEALNLTQKYNFLSGNMGFHLPLVHSPPSLSFQSSDL